MMLARNGKLLSQRVARGIWRVLAACCVRIALLPRCGTNYFQTNNNNLVTNRPTSWLCRFQQLDTQE